ALRRPDLLEAWLASHTLTRAEQKIWDELRSELEVLRESENLSTVEGDAPQRFAPLQEESE
ncbi:MAG TPA: hypothetical protein VF719_11030, partial [Abditibacteriaceae bacterium]